MVNNMALEAGDK